MSNRTTLVRLGPLLCVLGLASACSKSPILNHQEEEVRRAGGSVSGASQAPQNAINENNCPMSFNMPSTVSENAPARLCLQLRFSDPPREGNNTVRLDFSHDVDVREFNIDLWMPTMGHGSEPVILSQLASKSILIQDVWLIMPGLWQIRMRWRGQLVNYEFSL
jgi:hypothetical protein